jgi:hypothetical protein
MPVGGRAQQDVPAPLAEHLAKITVDVAKVTASKGPDAWSP